MAHLTNWKLSPEQLVGRSFVLCFLVFLCVPSLNLFPWGKLQQIDEAEHRALALYPHPQSWADLPSQFSSFVDDHFGFRDDFIQLRSSLSHFLHDSGSPYVIWGKHDWLFFLGDNTLPDLQRRADLSPAELAQFKGTILVNAQALEKLHIAYLYISAPNKSSIYPERIPTGIINPAGLSRLEALEQDVAADPTIRPHFLSLRPDLLQAKQNGDLYFQTDSHWNIRGAYFGYKAIMEMLRSNPVLSSTFNSPIIDSLTIPGSNFVLGAAGERDLGRIARHPFPNESEVVVSSLPRSPMNFCLPFLSEKWRRHFDTEPGFAPPSLGYNYHATNPQTVLLFGDSFSIYLTGYFRESFRRVIYVQASPGHSVDYTLLDDLVSRYHPQLVFEEVLERFLAYNGARNQLNRSSVLPTSQSDSHELDLSPLANGAWSLVRDGQREALRNIESGISIPIQPGIRENSQSIHASVDAITSTNDPTSESFTIAGWMVDAATLTPYDGLMITVGNLPVAFDIPDRNRPDVALFLKNPSSACCGFTTRITSRGITNPGALRLFAIQAKSDRIGFAIRELNISPDAVTTPISMVGLKLNKTPNGFSFQR